MSELSAQLADALPQGPAGSPDWITDLRNDGAQQFRAHGLPSRKDEAWKYTGLGQLGQRETHLATAGLSTGVTPALPVPVVAVEQQITMLDGQLLGVPNGLPDGVTVLSLNEALERGVSGLRSLLESLPASKQKEMSADGFTALNTATLGTGVVIHVSGGVDAGRLLMTWSTLNEDIARLFNSRICVMLEPAAKLELLEQFETPHMNANTSNVVLQVELGAGATLQHVRLQQESEETTLVTRTEVLQQAGSSYSYYGFDLGGGLVRHDLHTSLSGEGAETGINGAYLLDKKRHVDNHSRVDHLAKGGVSEQYFRGVAGGSGRAVFNTAVCVHPGADETEALQSNANILLSTRAEVDTKPELEIYADEVVASHGATVGQLDEQAVFYLRTRGLSEEQARQILTTAFCRSVSDKLATGAFADGELAEAISQRMMDVMPQPD